MVVKPVVLILGLLIPPSALGTGFMAMEPTTPPTTAKKLAHVVCDDRGTLVGLATNSYSLTLEINKDWYLATGQCRRISRADPFVRGEQIEPIANDMENFYVVEDGHMAVSGERQYRYEQVPFSTD